MLRSERDEIINIVEQKTDADSLYCSCSPSADVFFIYTLPGANHPHYMCVGCDRDYCLFGCHIPEIITNEESQYSWTGTACSVCGQPQYHAYGSGDTCSNGHGGAPGV